MEIPPEMKRNPRQRKTHKGKNVQVRRQRTAGYLDPMVDSFSDVGRACRRYLVRVGEWQPVDWRAR